MNIPAIELTRLEEAVHEAHSLAASGQITAGYEVLDLMLCWAESPAIDLLTGRAAPPEPWAAELSARYRWALVEYLMAHRLDASQPAPPPSLPPPRANLRERLAALCHRSRQLRDCSSSLLAQSRALRSTSRSIHLR